MEKITEVDQVLTGRNPQNIHALGKDFDELYLNKIYELSLSPESVKRFHDMKIVYSPMHGAGVWFPSRSSVSASPTCSWFPSRR